MRITFHRKCWRGILKGIVKQREIKYSVKKKAYSKRMRHGTALGFDSCRDDPTSQAAWRKRQTNEQTEWRNQAFRWEGGEKDNAPTIASSYQIIASSWSRIAIIDSPAIKHRCPTHDLITIFFLITDDYIT